MVSLLVFALVGDRWDQVQLGGDVYSHPVIRVLIEWHDRDSRCASSIWIDDHSEVAQ